MSDNAQTDPTWLVRDEEQVRAQVVAVVGVPRDLLLESKIELVSVKEDNTPFLNKEIISQPLWKVTTPKWRLRLASAMPGFEDQYERYFDILVDPRSGTILKITSRWPPGIPEMVPQPPADYAEAQMNSSGRERYHSFPANAPAITFLEALDVVLREGYGSPLEAKQILADCVVQSRMGGDPRTVWAITLRGIRIVRQPPPSLDGSSSSGRELVVDKMRNIVDATTGEWLGASNLPSLMHDPQRSAPALSPPPTVTLRLFSPQDGLSVPRGEIVEWEITATVSTGDNYGLSMVSVDLFQDANNLRCSTCRQATVLMICKISIVQRASATQLQLPIVLGMAELKLACLAR